MRDRRVLQDAVPEIEDVRAPGERVKDALDRDSQAPRRRRSARAGRDCPAPAGRRGSSLRRPDRIDRLVEADRVDSGFARIGARACRRRPWESRSPARPDVACLSASTSRAVGAITHRSNCAGARLPAQLSNNCTASAPASIWPRQIIERDRLDPLDDRGELPWIAIGQAPRLGLLAAALAGDHVGGDGPRAAGKADQGLRRIERAP